MPLCITCKQEYPDVDFIVRHRDHVRIDQQCHACRNKRAIAYRLRKGKKPNPRTRNIPTTHKRCSHCKIVKPLNAFHKGEHSCKPCKSEVCRKYYVNNTQIILERCKSYYENNKQRHLARTKDWQKRHPEKVKEWNSIQVRKYKARKRLAKRIERISLQVIFKRDQGICSLCHKKVKRQDASVDHIIPLSKGGDHTYQNCSLAHKGCNSRKNNRTATQQMRLF